VIPLQHPVRTMWQRNPPPPRPIMLDLVYHEANDANDTPEYWTVRMYRDNLKELDYSVEDTMAVHRWVNDIIKNLRMVTPHVYPEIFESYKGVK
jgi:hypothetical protein